MKKTIDKKKKNGEVFTPKALSDFLAERMLKYIRPTKHLEICDPSCGDGALLLALTRALYTNAQCSISIFGSDIDGDYLRKAEKCLISSFPKTEIHLCVEDFIEERMGGLFASNKTYDVIIGNPPYVRTQTIGNEKSQAIAKLYGLSGRVDLYYPFIINMTDSLKEGGVLGVITSNRYLTTKSGDCIRDYLLKNYDILEIIDLGDTKLFDAAVLPAIFIGKKNTSKEKSEIGSFVKIYESLNHGHIDGRKGSIYDVLHSEKNGCYQVGTSSYNLSMGTFVRPKLSTAVWQMNTKEERLWVDTIQLNTHFFVGERFNVRVGVKSCADEVFLDVENYNSDDKPEDVFFHTMISQENIMPWLISKNLPSVVYPHYDNNGKKDVLDIEKYPKARKFFSKHEARLKRRAYLMKSNRLWYEYWVPQNVTLWKYPKLVFPDISMEPRFAIDTTGAIINGNCYWLYASNEEDLNLLYLIEGVANSNLMVHYHDLCFNNKLYSGRRRYLTQYVEKYPVPNPTTSYAKRIIEIAKRLHSHVTEIEYKELVTELNISVEKAFHVV